MQKQSIVTTLEESEATTKLKMIKYIVLGAAAVTSFVYAKSCECELGIYATNENGRCLGELKHFDTPEIAESCDVIFEDLKLSVIFGCILSIHFIHTRIRKLHHSFELSVQSVIESYAVWVIRYAIEITECDSKGLNATLYHSTSCEKDDALFTEHLPDQYCKSVAVGKHKISLGTKCDEKKNMMDWIRGD